LNSPSETFRINKMQTFFGYFLGMQLSGNELVIEVIDRCQEKVFLQTGRRDSISFLSLHMTKLDLILRNQFFSPAAVLQNSVEFTKREAEAQQAVRSLTEIFSNSKVKELANNYFILSGARAIAGDRTSALKYAHSLWEVLDTLKKDREVYLDTYLAAFNLCFIFSLLSAEQLKQRLE